MSYENNYDVMALYADLDPDVSRGETFQISVRCVQGTIYVITLDANGGTVSHTRRTTDTNGRLASLPVPKSRTEYNFAGWYTADVGGTQVTAGTTGTVFSGDAVIYARWTAINPPSVVSTFTDSRDGKTYKKVAIGARTWMAENLNYDVPNNAADGCLGYNNMNCIAYGRLYNWTTARDVCPAGWHLPGNAEWDTLVSYAGGSMAGTRLKSSADWNGFDNYGFSAKPGGAEAGGSNDYYSVDGYGYWWSATEYQYNTTHASSRSMSAISGSVNKNDFSDKRGLLSVRCVED